MLITRKLLITVQNFVLCTTVVPHIFDIEKKEGDANLPQKATGLDPVSLFVDNIKNLLEGLLIGLLRTK
jgi:hypothetical protein